MWNEDTWWSDRKKWDPWAFQQLPIPDEEGAAVGLVLLFWPFPLCLWPPLLLPPPPDFGCNVDRTKPLNKAVAALHHNAKNNNKCKDQSPVSTIQPHCCFCFLSTQFTLFSLLPSFNWGSSSPSPFESQPRKQRRWRECTGVMWVSLKFRVKYYKAVYRFTDRMLHEKKKRRRKQKLAEQQLRGK